MSTEATLSPSTRRAESSTAWLWWKEVRQLSPLVVLLVAVSLLILLIIMLMGSITSWKSFSLPSEVMLLVFPGLLATGAGPLLVGQERALRTIDWLSLLPISVRRLAWTKLLVGLLGLAVMWAFVGIAVSVFGLASVNAPRWTVGQTGTYSTNPYSYPFWISHSIFVLLCGFFVSWRIKNQFHSLITLIPLAFAPMLLVSIGGSIFYDRMPPATAEWAMFWITLVGIAIMVPLGHRAAVRTLGPDPAPSVTPLLNLPTRSATGDQASASAPRFGTQVAPMIWQSIHSARATWAILLAMLVMSLLAILMAAWFHDWHSRYGVIRAVLNFVPLFLVPAPLAISWLGVTVFKHDGAADQLRFLADRGISPRKAYWARHAVPIAILSLALLAYAGLMIAAPVLAHRNYEQGPFLAPSLITVLLFAMAIYGVSQWISQMFRTQILAVILAPVISLMVIGWFFFVTISYHFPPWATAMLLSLPMLVTRLVMRRYMDQRDRPAIFIWSAILAACLVAVPLLDAGAKIRSVAKMPMAQKKELLAEAKPLAVERPSPIYTSLLENNVAIDRFDWDAGRSFTPVEILRKDMENRSEDIDALIQRFIDVTPGAAQIDNGQHSSWTSQFTLAYMQWVNAQESESDAAFETFVSWIDYATAVLKASRSVLRIQEQMIADRTESTLVHFLQSDALKPYLDHESMIAARAAIGTPESRAEQRRKAVLADWYASKYLESNIRRGSSFNLAIQNHLPSGLQWTLREYYEEQWVLALLEGIEQSRSGPSDVDKNDEDSWLRRVHALESPAGVFESSRYGFRLRKDRVIPDFLNRYPPDVCSLWGCDWEYVRFE